MPDKRTQVVYVAASYTLVLPRENAMVVWQTRTHAKAEITRVLMSEQSIQNTNAQSPYPTLQQTFDPQTSARHLNPFRRLELCPLP